MGKKVTRVERTHWMSGGRQLLVASLEDLRPEEKEQVPPSLLERLQSWPDVLAMTPEELSFARDGLRAREPLLERSQHDDRVYWSLRFPLYGDAERVKHACFGARGGRLGGGLPAPLQWLGSTFGDCDLCSEWSGSAPWGRRLSELQDRMFEGVVEQLPDGAGDWLALYEVDGDWVFADPVGGHAHWVGVEWTGVPDTVFPDWVPVMRFVLWRLLDGGFVRPSDLHMLFG